MATAEDSILRSIRLSLGIPNDDKSFDPAIIMLINSAISTLRQLGIGPKTGFTVIDESQTYGDFLSDMPVVMNDVEQYIFYKTKLGFDAPSTNVSNSYIEAQIHELEWRLNAEVDPPYLLETEGWG